MQIKRDYNVKIFLIIVVSAISLYVMAVLSWIELRADFDGHQDGHQNETNIEEILFSALLVCICLLSYTAIRLVLQGNKIQHNHAANIANQESGERLTGSGHLTWDIESGDIECSAGLKALLGMGDVKEDGITFSDIEFRDENDRQRIVDWFDAGLNSGVEELEPNVTSIVKPNGDVVRVRLCGRFEFGEASDGKAVKLYGTVQDITEDRQAESRAQTYIDSSEDMFLALGPAGKILDANQKSLELLAVDRHDLIGLKWSEQFVAEEDRSGVNAQFMEVSESGILNKAFTQEYAIILADHSRRQIKWNFSLQTDASGRMTELLMFGRDVTAQRRTERQLSDFALFTTENPNPVFRINRFGEVLIANHSAREISERVSAGESSSNSKGAWSNLLASAKGLEEPTESELSFEDQMFRFIVIPVADQGYTNFYGSDVTDAHELSLTQQGIAHNFPGAIFRYCVEVDGSHGITFLSEGCEELWETSAEELNEDPSRLWDMIIPEERERIEHSVTESADRLADWSVRYRIQTPSGKKKVLQAYGTPRLRDDGSTIWDSIIIDVTEEARSTALVKQALNKTIAVLSAALEARDPYTVGHEKSVARISALISESMGFSEDWREGLFLAATVHDIGKINLPAEILSKPTKLTAPEYELIKGHSQVGADILSGVEFDRPISNMILQHHERFDGSGYPLGLSGQEILMEARILAVADTIDAMSSHRPYRPSLGLAAAMAEIEDGAGVRYDPDVARAAVSLYESGKLRENHEGGGIDC